jgi:flavodoxin
MRLAVVHLSIHHQNTVRIAEAMAQSIQARLLTISEARDLEATKWDLVGLGSGIFFSKHHRQLLEFATHWPDLPKDCFVFSTAGIKFLSPYWHRELVQILEGRGCRVLGQFCSPGWDTVGPLKYFGGIHRGRPNARDLLNAGVFARNVLDKLLAEKQSSGGEFVATN